MPIKESAEDSGIVTSDSSNVNQLIKGHAIDGVNVSSPITNGDITMADIITGTTTGVVDTSTLQAEHSDIRRENEHNTGTLRYNIKEGTNEEVKETLKAAWAGVDATKDSRFDLSTRITNSKDNILDRLFTIGRDVVDNRSQITALGYQVRDGFVAAAKDAEINALKTQMEIAKQTTYLSDKIDGGNKETVALINTLKEADLSRMLIERNAEIVEERHAARHWRGNFDQSQWAALNNQLQAFQSQLQETRQNMVNFGTMAGVGQSSTSNNVR